MHDDLMPEKCLTCVFFLLMNVMNILQAPFVSFFHCGFSCKLVLEEVPKMSFSGSSGAGEQTAALFCLHLVLLWDPWNQLKLLHQCLWGPAKVVSRVHETMLRDEGYFTAFRPILKLEIAALAAIFTKTRHLLVIITSLFLCCAFQLGHVTGYLRFGSFLEVKSAGDRDICYLAIVSNVKFAEFYLIKWNEGLTIVSPN